MAIADEISNINTELSFITGLISDLQRHSLLQDRLASLELPGSVARDASGLPQTLGEAASWVSVVE
eukprot:superscaffoldBa00006304_g21374